MLDDHDQGYDSDWSRCVGRCLCGASWRPSGVGMNDSPELPREMFICHCRMCPVESRVAAYHGGAPWCAFPRLRWQGRFFTQRSSPFALRGACGACQQPLCILYDCEPHTEWVHASAVNPASLLKGGLAAWMFLGMQPKHITLRIMSPGITFTAPATLRSTLRLQPKILLDAAGASLRFAMAGPRGQASSPGKLTCADLPGNLLPIFAASVGYHRVQAAQIRMAPPHPKSPLLDLCALATPRC